MSRMVGWARGQRRQPTSRWVGVAVAGLYAVITTLTGVALLATGQQLAAQDQQLDHNLGATGHYTTTTTPSATGSTPTTTTHRSAPVQHQHAASTPPATSSTPQRTEQAQARAVPAGYRLVAGPGGITTVVPASWPRARSSGPGAAVATDPAHPQRYLKYGGAAAANTDILMTHLMYESQYAARSTNYQRLRLAETTMHGAPAVDWDFTVDGPDGTTLRVQSRYWRVRGTEYFVLAADTAADWSRAAPVYRYLVDSAQP